VLPRVAGAARRHDVRDVIGAAARERHFVVVRQAFRFTAVDADVAEQFELLKALGERVRSAVACFARPTAVLEVALFYLDGPSGTPKAMVCARSR